MSVSVLFICSQNTCRSAAADAVFSYVVRETGVDIAVDSAGISAEDGLPPSENIQQAGRLRGYDLSNLRSRLFTRSDFLHFDSFIGHGQVVFGSIKAQFTRRTGAKNRVAYEIREFF